MRLINQQLHSNFRLALCVSALALGGASCGRSLSTAPEPATSVRPADPADPFAVSGLENQVVVTLAPGADAKSLAAQYGAMVVNSDNEERTARRTIHAA